MLPISVFLHGNWVKNLLLNNMTVSLVLPEKSANQFMATSSGHLPLLIYERYEAVLYSTHCPT